MDAYRSEGNTVVDDAAAIEAWSRAARPVLVQVARHYGALTSPADLAEEVQALSGVRTREAPAVWVDDVLDAVAVECIARDEPWLSAFCVGVDGRMGERYRAIVGSVDSGASDIEMHAANQRVEAHRYHGATLPVDGGRPTLPPELAKQRTSAPKSTTTRTRTARAKAPAAPRRHKNPEITRAVCPTCFLQLPATGRCDNCDE